uniref:Holin n=1 Tax=Siphoviridae sp. ctYM922 TaxID=2825547 RepID=A0A8S5U9E3_9CAUD|nr:MAG TPA: holin [Siphoviridae sp. ctYM922]
MEDFMNIMQQMHLQFNSEIWLLVIPALLMVLDILTGYINAWKKHEIKSQKMRDGLGKKVAEICYIIIGFVFRFATGLSSIAYALSMYVTYMELVSILENTDKLGLPIPKFIRDKLNNNNNNKTKDKSEDV